MAYGIEKGGLFITGNTVPPVNRHKNQFGLLGGHIALNASAIEKAEQEAEAPAQAPEHIETPTDRYDVELS